MSTPMSSYPPPSPSDGIPQHSQFQQPQPHQPAPKGSGLGIAALVLGIISLALCWVPVINVVFIICGFVGLVLGIVGIFKSHRVMSIIGSVCAVLGIILGITVNTAFVNEVDRQVNQSAPAGVAQPAEANGPAAKGESAGATPLGQSASDGSLTFTVTKVNETSSLGSGPLSSTAQGKYVVVNVQARNEGDQAAMVDATSQKAATADGKQFSTSSDALMSGDNTDQALFFEQINPGNTVDGRLVFDVPESADLSTITLHGGFFSDGVQMALQ